jgi:hypothetical protein
MLSMPSGTAQRADLYLIDSGSLIYSHILLVKDYHLS